MNESRVRLELGSILEIIDPVFCGFSIDTSEAVNDNHWCQLVSRGIINIGDVIGVRISLSADGGPVYLLIDLLNGKVHRHDLIVNQELEQFGALQVSFEADLVSDFIQSLTKLIRSVRVLLHLFDEVLLRRCALELELVLGLWLHGVDNLAYLLE